MIPMFKKILFATDLSQNSRHAFYFAASIATRYEGGIVLLHVMQKLPSGVENTLANFLGDGKWQEMRQDQEAKARHILIGKKRDHEIIRNALDVFCSTASIGQERCSFDTYEILIKAGKVVDVIINTAKETGCDAIVMGAHKGLLGSTAVGSVTKGVLQLARVPVLVVPPPELTETGDQ